jgi:hypothetical protein
MATKEQSKRINNAVNAATEQALSQYGKAPSERIPNAYDPRKNETRDRTTGVFKPSPYGRDGAV